MFLIAALLLSAGLLVSINFGSFFGKITQELNASDVYYIVSSHSYSQEMDNYLKNHENVLKMQKEDSLWTKASVPYNDDAREVSFLLNDADSKRNLSKWKLMEGNLSTDAMSIYLPYVMRVDGGYKLNDTFKMTFKDNTVLTFTIKGFTEDVFFSSFDTGVLGAYLPHETYERVTQLLGDKYNAAVIFANLNKKDKNIETEISEMIKTDNTVSSKNIISRQQPLVKMSRTMMADIIAVMMVAFAVIIAIVCLIVVRFRIGNSIEDDMTKIGSLKAIGYTSRQIVLSIVIQFSIIALVGSIVGISLSYLTTPVLSDVFAHQSGLMWTQGFDGAISSIALFSILFIIIIVSFISAGRIHKLNPIVALRGGITTHTFRKNHLPLHTSRGSLPLVLAFKSMLQNMKQSLMIGIILVAVSFASTFAVVMFYNTTIDTRTFAETPGVELSNAVAVLNPKADNVKLVEKINNLSNVRKVQFIDETMIKIENNDVSVYVMDDYTKKETNTIYEGRYPIHSNEVVLAGILANMLQKNIGDNVALKFEGKQAEYIVTGLTQGASMGGMNASVTRDGIVKINPNFKQQNLQIYLDKDTKADEFVKKLKNTYGDYILVAIDMDRDIELGMGIYTSIVSKVGVAMLVVMILVVILVLYFVISSSVIRRKRELGVQKAIGFTTFQLMNQLSLGFLAPIIIGVFTGSVIGITQTNAIMSDAQRAMGIMKANYIVAPAWIALFGIAIVIVSYVTSMLITYRIRKISAYALVSE
jgi:putative ABC transport system permease protein